MPVAHGGVGDQQLRARLHPVCHGLRALLFQQVPRPHLRLTTQRGWLGVFQIGGGARPILGFGMPVDGDIGDIGQNLRAPVAPLGEHEQIRRLVDELGRVFVRQERRVLQQVFDKRDVGADAPDTELAQGTVHPRDGHFGCRCPGRHLFQKRVVIPRDHGPRICRTAIEADAHSGGPPVSGDAAVVGNEVVLWVFRRDPRLQGVTMQRDVFLPVVTRCFGDGFAFGDQDLGPDDVDARHLFGHGVFDLNAGIDLDEVEVAGFHIHQELDSAGAFVIDVLADLVAKIADLGPLRIGQVRGRGAFNDLLVAALNRTVPFEKVVHPAMLVAEDLNLDVPRPRDHLFEVTLAIAKGRLGLAAALQHLFFKLILAMDRAHAAPATAPRRLEHQGVSDLGRFLADRLHVVAQNFGRGDDGHASLDGNTPRAGLVAKGPHRFRLGSDKGDPRLFAGFDQFGVLGQQTITGMDRIRPALARHANDLVNAEIGGNRSQPFADQISFVRLETVQAQLVLFGKDGDGFLAHLVRRPHDADRDLAPVCNEDFAEFGHRCHPFRNVTSQSQQGL